MNKQKIKQQNNEKVMVSTGGWTLTDQAYGPLGWYIKGVFPLTFSLAWPESVLVSGRANTGKKADGNTLIMLKSLEPL